MKFRLSCQVTVSAYTEVDADSLDEAIQAATGREVVIGGLHSGTRADESWVIDDADGEATNIVASV
jgi:hypothetical protein